MAIEGNYVKAGDPIYRIAELSTLWLMLELFPEDASRIRFAQRVEATIQSLPGESFLGRVAFISPTVDAKTRTVGVRVELLNEKKRLRPGDYAEAQITVPIGPQGTVFDADLAGNPSRAIATGKERKGPLVFEQIDVQPIGGEAGLQVDALYANYFQIQ